MGFLRHGSFRTVILFLYLLSIRIDICHSQDERSVRLVDGESPRTGRVEIYNADLWATVTINGWTNTEAAVVCRQLGFQGPAVTKTFGPARIGIQVPVVSVQCPDNAISLADCKIDLTESSVLTDASLDYLNGLEYWEHDENAGVDCQGTVPPSPGFPTILNIVPLVVVLCLIVLCVFLIYRLCNIWAEAKEPVDPEESEERSESFAMCSSHIDKDNSEIHGNPGERYASINPVEVEPESNCESPHCDVSSTAL